MRTINRILTVVAAVSMAAVTGCAAQGGDSSAPPPAASPAAASAGGSAQAPDAVITIKDFTYELPVSVTPGAMVTLKNADTAPHTLTVKDGGGDGADIEVPGGGTVIFPAPDTPGEYEIICTFHPQMSGTLVVK